MEKREAVQIIQREIDNIEKDLQRAEYLDLPFLEALSKKKEALTIALEEVKPREAYWIRTRIVFDELGNRHYDCVCSNCRSFSRNLPSHCPRCGYTMIEVKSKGALE